jgi:hypothetical protein
MKRIFGTILTLFTTLSYSQTSEYKLTTLTEAFNQDSAGTQKDFCTTKNIKIVLVFSGNVQRVVPDRASKLNKVLHDCGLEQTQDWTGGTTEISAFENGNEFWLQVDKPADNQLLSKIHKGETITIYGQLLCEHTYNAATTFIIVKKIEKKK